MSSNAGSVRVMLNGCACGGGPSPRIVGPVGAGGWAAHIVVATDTNSPRTRCAFFFMMAPQLQGFFAGVCSGRAMSAACSAAVFGQSWPGQQCSRDLNFQPCGVFT